MGAPPSVPLPGPPPRPAGCSLPSRPARSAPRPAPPRPRVASAPVREPPARPRPAAPTGSPPPGAPPGTPEPPLWPGNRDASGTVPWDGGTAVVDWAATPSGVELVGMPAEDAELPDAGVPVCRVGTEVPAEPVSEVDPFGATALILLAGPPPWDWLASPPGCCPASALVLCWLIRDSACLTRSTTASAPCTSLSRFCPLDSSAASFARIC